MASGLLALLDDVAVIAKLAAASVDDLAAQTAKAGVKAAGIVIDDTAVTPRYVVGLSPERELPIIWRIALGSLKNKILILLPAALLLSAFVPWAITPLLMAGGAYLCFEGAEKVAHKLFHHEDQADAQTISAATSPKAVEDEKVAGAVRTDIILSAEIMAITLSTVADQSFWTQVIVLGLVGVGVTALVYGVVGLIVKADDVGLVLAKRGGPVSRPVGLALVHGMPPFLTFLGALGTAAMLWVGGGIVLHGLEEYHLGAPAHWIHDVAHAFGAWATGLVGLGPAAALEWLAGATGAGLFGLALGIMIIPLVSKLVMPLLRKVKPIE